LSEEAGEARPRRPYRRIAALVVLVGGAAAIATTVSTVKKEPATLVIALPAGIRGLRLDVHREGSSAHALVEHLEWSYVESAPATQEADLDLTPGKYLLTMHALGPSQRDPEPRELEVRKGEPAKLKVDLRGP
jgi:hypothetical protein